MKMQYNNEGDDNENDDHIYICEHAWPRLQRPRVYVWQTFLLLNMLPRLFCGFELFGYKFFAASTFFWQAPCFCCGLDLNLLFDMHNFRWFDLLFDKLQIFSSACSICFLTSSRIFKWVRLVCLTSSRFFGGFDFFFWQAPDFFVGWICFFLIPHIFLGGTLHFFAHILRIFWLDGRKANSNETSYHPLLYRFQNCRKNGCLKPQRNQLVIGLTG